MLEDSPGLESTEFGEIARGVRAVVDRAEEAPTAAARGEPFVGRRRRPEKKASNRECDGVTVDDLVRYDLTSLVEVLWVTILLVLGSGARHREGAASGWGRGPEAPTRRSPCADTVAKHSCSVGRLGEDAQRNFT